MTTIAIVALVIGAIALALVLGFIGLKIYASTLINRGEWLNTNRPAWLEWLLDNLT